MIKFAPYNFFTDPLNNDTDNDGFSDGDEIYIYHTNPLIPNNGDDDIETPLYKEAWFWSAIWATGTLGFGIFGYIRKMKKTPKGTIKKLPKLKRKSRKSKKPKN